MKLLLFFPAIRGSLGKQYIIKAAKRPPVNNNCVLFYETVPDT
jgi:hypothetical protein